MADLNAFADRLLDERGFRGSDPAFLAEAKSQILEELEGEEQAVIKRHLPAHKAEEYEMLLDQSDAQAREYAARNIPDLESLMSEMMERFRRDYLERHK